MTDHAQIHPIDVLLHKRDGRALSDAEIEFFVRAVVDHTVSDAQIGAFLMAVWLRGLDARELATLTRAMRFSGEVFDPTPLHAFAVDKHSTGGVGDKTSLLIAPIIAAVAFKEEPPQRLVVPMISGRSLGHTGGTLDKLESIPGYHTQLTSDQFAAVLSRCGASIIGQSPKLVPADRILYAMRDHTGTVESPNLICASIMSKKLAAGLNGLVLDVKTGSGAFMSRYEDSEHLARLMVATGEAAGTRTAALLTSMDEPLGRFSGNWVEVWECIDILQNKQDALHQRVLDLLDAVPADQTGDEGRLGVELGGLGEEGRQVDLGGDDLVQAGRVVASEPRDDLVHLLLAAALPLHLGDVERVDAGERDGEDAVSRHV